jgi:polyphosphate kinase
MKIKNDSVYFNRELSWLDFNDRVLHEAYDPRNPLIERLKFLAIFSSNLDEFFMVRVSGILEHLDIGFEKENQTGLTPAELIIEIRLHLQMRVREQHALFDNVLQQALDEEGIVILKSENMTPEQHQSAKQYFENKVFPVLTPLIVDASHPFPRMANLSLNLAVEVEDPETGTIRFARVKVPDSLPRFVPLSTEDQQATDQALAVLPLEHLIADNLTSLFPGMKIIGQHGFRITRDGDFPIKESEADDLLIAVETEISKRRIDGFVCRLEISETMPENLKEQLIKDLAVRTEDVYVITGLMNLKDLFYFATLNRTDLKYSEWQPVIPPRIRAAIAAEADHQDAETPPDLFSAIREGDLMVHHPYDSFGHTVEALINNAADDPQVLAIKMTLYRTSGDSPIIHSLIRAAKKGKQVVVLIEVLARFDEANNIEWAKKLELAGIHVVYGVIGLKTHTKTTLIVRKENNQLTRYCHIGTGNYNSKTACLYTDIGIFTCRNEIGNDLTHLFNYLTGYSRQNKYQELLVAPLTLRPGMEGLIRREIDIANSGRPAQIIAKMNSLTDLEMIDLLYEASKAGVRIQLIIRGVCCLRPGIKGLSDNITVTSIIGRFLEHSRIFLFRNDGDESFYIGSADWMTRNLDRRVEAIVPIHSPELRAQLSETLTIMLEDNRQAWDLDEEGGWRQRNPLPNEEERATQSVLMDTANQRDRTWAKNLSEENLQDAVSALNEKLWPSNQV